jgi:hypothetical protein
MPLAISKSGEVRKAWSRHKSSGLRRDIHTFDNNKLVHASTLGIFLRLHIRHINLRLFCFGCFWFRIHFSILKLFGKKVEAGLDALRFIARVYECSELLGIFMLDHSLALRLRSRNGLPRVRIARIHGSTFGARARSSARALFFLTAARRLRTL